MNDCLIEAKDPSIHPQKPTAGSTMAATAGHVFPHSGLPPISINFTAVVKQVYKLGESIGFFGKGSSKITRTDILGKISSQKSLDLNSFRYVRMWSLCIQSCIILRCRHYINTKLVDVNTYVPVADTANLLLVRKER